MSSNLESVERTFLYVATYLCVQAAILDNIAIYADKYDEEFKEYFPSVVSGVWNLLVGWGDKGRLAKYDLIITSAMKFLAGVVSREMHMAVFQVCA